MVGIWSAKSQQARGADRTQTAGSIESSSLHLSLDSLVSVKVLVIRRFGHFYSLSNETCGEIS
jgi:hypothetical protein